MAILKPFGAITDHYMRLNGWNDKRLAKAVGCSATMIYKLKKGNAEYCGISLISRVAIALGFSLEDWLKVEKPKSREGAFGRVSP